MMHPGSQKVGIVFRFTLALPRQPLAYAADNGGIRCIAQSSRTCLIARQGFREGASCSKQSRKRVQQELVFVSYFGSIIP